jgi:hypothetical protein
MWPGHLAGPTSWQLKLERARQHLADLRQAVDAFLEAGHYDLAQHRAPDGSYIEVRLIAGQEPDPRLSVIIGDVLHNARSAIDSLVYALAEHHQGRELTREEAQSTQFPFSTRPEGWPDGQAPRFVRLLSPRAIEAVRMAQPNYWGYGGDGHPLLMLRELSNIDKHRQVLLAICHLDVHYISTPEGVEVGWQPGGAVRHAGDVIGRWKLLSGPELPDELTVTGHFQVSLGDAAGEWRQSPAVDLLSSILGDIDMRVVPLLQAAF